MIPKPRANTTKQLFDLDEDVSDDEPLDSNDQLANHNKTL